MRSGASILETQAFRLTLDDQITGRFNDKQTLGQNEDAQEALSGRLKFLYLGDNGTEL
ncbi:hypothetical protein ROLI_038770 [Roseobacter fucihabitans]|uniref:Uncharacterized protein n=2 Tax=Roseobacter fucihabitans TaxID=1537242 RepID=A0ABZ2BXU4_9RHOB|nr:hypothetical protein [Roseobacter litoralis]